jgi:hypothetical protein
MPLAQKPEGKKKQLLRTSSSLFAPKKSDPLLSQAEAFLPQHEGLCRPRAQFP